MITRRSFLSNSAFLSLAPIVPAFLSRTARAAGPERDGRILVVLQLDGGNDGINTVVPFGDEGYAKHRRELRLPTEKLLKVADGLGLHPSMRAAADLLESGRLAIVQGVGYPNPNRSHFESMAIWQTASLAPPGTDARGWLGRALDSSGPSGIGPDSVYVGDRNLPLTLASRRAVSTSFSDASDLALALSPPRPAATSIPDASDLAAYVNRTVTNAYATAAELEAATARGGDAAARYPDSELGKQMGLIARSIKSGSSARVYYAIQDGYDTHAVQLPTHSQLLREFSGALRAFLDDLDAAKLGDRVIVLAFSEFGRRPEENGSLGTDHGTAGPVFLAGSGVRPGLVGKAPALGDLRDCDLAWSCDFRCLYAALLEGWLGLPKDEILGGHFDPLPVLRA